MSGKHKSDDVQNSLSKNRKEFTEKVLHGLTGSL